MISNSFIFTFINVHTCMAPAVETASELVEFAAIRPRLIPLCPLNVCVLNL